MLKKVSNKIAIKSNEISNKITMKSDMPRNISLQLVVF